MAGKFGGVIAPPGSAHSLATIEEILLDDYVKVTLCLLLTSVPTQRSVFMRVLRLTIPAIVFAVVLVGCIVQADTFSDQNPFSAPDTLQSGEDGQKPTETPPPDPPAEQSIATPAATSSEASLEATIEAPRIEAATNTPEPTATPVPPTATPLPTATTVPSRPTPFPTVPSAIQTATAGKGGPNPGK